MHITKTKKARFFGGSCRGCGQTFAVPCSADFACGEIILTGHKGTVFAYLTLFNPIADEVRNILESLGKDDVESILPVVLSKIADTIEGQTLQLPKVCPSCQSDKVSLNESQIIAEQEIPIASFKRFLISSKSEREREITELIQEKILAAGNS
ncbi:MAG: hypothetical protein AB7O96_09520 [Pseudobdellovibrionaceae bacterium]